MNWPGKQMQVETGQPEKHVIALKLTQSSQVLQLGSLVIKCEGFETDQNL